MSYHFDVKAGNKEEAKEKATELAEKEYDQAVGTDYAEWEAEIV